MPECAPLATPKVVTKVCTNDFLLWVFSRNSSILSRSFFSYSAVIRYSPWLNFISHRWMILSARSMIRSIWLPLVAFCRSVLLNQAETSVVSHFVCTIKQGTKLQYFSKFGLKMYFFLKKIREKVCFRADWILCWTCSVLLLLFATLLKTRNGWREPIGNKKP